MSNICVCSVLFHTVVPSVRNTIAIPYRYQSPGRVQSDEEGPQKFRLEQGFVRRNSNLCKLARREMTIFIREALGSIPW